MGKPYTDHYNRCSTVGDKTAVPGASREPKGGLTILRGSERTPRKGRGPRGCVGSSQADPRASITHSHSDTYSLAVDKKSPDHTRTSWGTRRWDAGHPCPTAWVCTLPRCPLLGQAAAHCAHSSPPRVGGGAAGPRGEERSLWPPVPLAFREASVPTRAKPLFFSHTKPLAWLPAPAPAPPPAKQPPLLANSPSLGRASRVPSRAPMHGPISRAVPTPRP